MTNTRMAPQRFIQAANALLDASAARRASLELAEREATEALRQRENAHAIPAIKRVLALRPDAADWWNALATIRLQCGDSEGAAVAWREALCGKLERVETLHRIGRDLAEAGYDPAGFASETWASHPPPAGMQEPWLDILRCNWTGALPAFRNAYLLQPAQRVAARNLSFLFERLGRPGHAQCVLAANRLSQGRIGEAVEAFDAAPQGSACAPEFLDFYLLALRRAGEEQRAIHIAASTPAAQRTPETYLEWARALMDLHRCTEALEILRLGAAMLDDPYLQQQAELMMPAVPASQVAMDAAYQRARRGIQALADIPLPTSPAHLARLEDTLQPNFLLAYTGSSCVEEARAYGRFACALMRERHPHHSDRSLPKRPHGAGERLRIGYATSYASKHVVMMYFAGWLQHANRELFELHLFPLASEASQVSGYLASLADVCHPGTDRTEVAARQIMESQLDVLVYPEVGLDPLGFRLAALRLAPVQCAASGHPVTTGLETIDYFLSFAAAEPPDAAAHYTERLVGLPGTGITLARPALPANRRGRGDFGLATTDVVYLSAQSLFKYLPRHDDVYARIAQSVPNAVFVFIEGDFPAWTRTLQERLRPTFEARGLAPERHLRFLPRQNYEDYLALTACSDIALDPPAGFAAGMTAIDALACGVPVVTLPGPLMRNRLCYSILSGLGVTDTVATSLEAYVACAARLGQDPALRADVSRRVQEPNQLLFDNVSGTQGLEAFFRWATGAGREGDRCLFTLGPSAEQAV